MIEKKHYSVIGLGILSLFLMAILISQSSVNEVPSDQTTSLNYYAEVCTTHRNSNGDILMHECSPNLLTDVGKNLTMHMLSGGGGVSAVDYIALCNATAGCADVLATDLVLENEYIGSGLTRVQATHDKIGTGNWSEYTTFTSTEDNILTNKTGIFNASTAGTLFAENTFTLVTLQTNDQLTINWTIQVT